jgi:hypothetical protein
MPQTSYANQSATAAFAGMLADGSDNEVSSYVQAEASAEVAFGRMVKHGTLDTDALILTAGTNKLAGIVTHAHNYAKDTELGSTGLKPKAQLNILRKGRVWVAVEEAVAVGGAVRVRHTASGGNTAVGGFATTAEAAKTMDISKFARYLTSTTAAGFALLEIDMVGASQAAADT